MKKALNLFGLLQFWGWNIVGLFLFTYLMGILVLPFAAAAFFTGEMPVSIFLCILVTLALPFLGLWVGITRQAIAIPFFFGVQIPVLVLCILRMSVMRELTFGGGLMVYTALIAGLVFAWHLFKSIPKSEEKETELPGIAAAPLSPSHRFMVLPMTLVLIAGVFTGLLGILYALPLLAELLKGFFSFNWLQSFLDLPELLVFLLFLAFFGFTMLALVCFPAYVGWYYPKAWWASIKAAGGRASVRRSVLISMGISALWLGLHFWAGGNAGAGHVYALQKSTGSELRVEMETPDKVRKSLLDAYLHEYRYLGTHNFQNNLEQIYDGALNARGAGRAAQSVQTYLLGPFIYKGNPDDKAVAAKLYDHLFDEPIQRAERKTISKALQATFNRDEVTAGLMNIGARNVMITDQAIRSEDRGDYAIIEIEEAYKNLTFELQEIFYYFSLPEDAVLTGIWIGQTANRAEMDAYIVAPRGAAQKVYEAQVARRIDPALLEQVGPSQYRLRVFPIPVSRMRAQFNWESRIGFTDDEAEPMRVHMRYVVPRSEAGFALPVLSEKRNVDWGRKTTRSVNGAAVKSADNWMPQTHIPAAQHGDVNLSSQLGQQSIMAKSLNTADVAPPKGRYAVIVDTSYSMRSFDADIARTLSGFADWQLVGSEIDYYPQNANERTYFGSATYQGLLEESGAISLDYDGVILLTDKGRYARNAGIDKKALTLAMPLWILHVGEAPSALDDAVLDAIYRSGGGLVGDIESLAASISLNTDRQRVQGGRLWEIDDDVAGAEMLKDTALDSLAARQVILQNSFGTQPDNAALDRFHTLAKTYDVVSPYSSMIVLVNERQKEALREASETEDRFEREGRSGEENLTAPSSPMVSGVPEPHEWLLIILSCLLLLWLWRRRDQWTDMPMA